MQNHGSSDKQISIRHCEGQSISSRAILTSVHFGACYFLSVIRCYAVLITVDSLARQGGRISSRLVQDLVFPAEEIGILYQPTAVVKYSKLIRQEDYHVNLELSLACLLYTSPSPRDRG